jgi:predicted lipoprotein with Yx(FWY)xxD motif
MFVTHVRRKARYQWQTHRCVCVGTLLRGVRSLECDSNGGRSHPYESTTRKRNTILMQATPYLFGLALLVTACGDNKNNAQTNPDASAVVADSAQASDSITLSTAGGLGAHLVDSQGKTLYFFANDLPGSNASTYTGAEWPTYDVQSPTVGAGLAASDFSRFDRGGGTFQTTWRGRPLYYYANDTVAAPTAGEGIGARWFAARAYDLFFGTNAAVTPEGSTAGAPFLTDDAGRTLYVFQKDTRATGGGPPTSDCGTTPCATYWPLWQAPASLADLIIPSTIVAANLTSFTNGSEGQFVYMGWPLYFYAADTNPGEVAGASVASWYAVNGGWDGTISP